MFNKTFIIIIFSLFALASSAQAQGKSAKKKSSAARPASAEQIAVVETSAAADDPAQFRRDFIKASEEYRDSLKSLAASQEKGLKRLEEQHEKLKGLYADGLISRREFDASDASVAEARAKFADVGKEFARAETVIAAALKPAPAVAVGTVELAAAPVVVRNWTTGNRNIDGMIRYYGGKHGVDPYLIYCVMHQESRFGSTATSYKGAQGLMQLMPGTAARYGVTNSYDPAQNIQAGTRYLRDLLRLFNGRVDLALAGYNAGEGAVMKYGNRIPPYRETRDYVRTIGTRYAGGSGLQPVIKPVAAKPKGR